MFVNSRKIYETNINLIRKLSTYLISVVKKNNTLNDLLWNAISLSGYTGTSTSCFQR